MSRRRMMQSLQGNGIEYVGSVYKAASSAGNIDSAGEALNVLSIAEVGDLVVIAFSFDEVTDTTWSWGGMPFSSIYNQTGSSTIGAYVGYRFVEPSDSNPYLIGVPISSYSALSIIASVFKNVTSYDAYSAASGTSGNPNPPSLTSSSKLWIATGHLDDDGVTMAAMSNYTLASSVKSERSLDRSTTAIAYRIEELTSDDPAAFVSPGDDNWRATTLAFS